MNINDCKNGNNLCSLVTIKAWLNLKKGRLLTAYGIRTTWSMSDCWLCWKVWHSVSVPQINFRHQPLFNHGIPDNSSFAQIDDNHWAEAKAEFSFTITLYQPNTWPPCTRVTSQSHLCRLWQILGYWNSTLPSLFIQQLSATNYQHVLKTSSYSITQSNIHINIYLTLFVHNWLRN